MSDSAPTELDCGAGSKHGMFAVNLSRIGQQGGLKVYSEALVSCLRQKYPNIQVIAPRFNDGEWGAHVSYTPGLLASSAKISTLRPVLWFLYSRFRFPVDRDIPVLSTTHHVVPRRERQIVTVHDLRPYFFPDSITQRWYFHGMLGRALKRCDGILTVSETSKRQLAGIYGIDARKIHVVPNCVDLEDFRPDPLIKSSKRPYLLMVGCSWRHKNLTEVLKNADLWSPKYSLKVVAGNGQYIREMEQLALQSSSKPDLEFLTNVPKRTLIQLYQGCAALLYPSLMEGFGIPPLEAMACARPVIASDIEVFRELYGEVPLYVSHGNRATWVRAFAELDNPSDMRSRIEGGLRLSTTYNMDRMCSALMAALKAIWEL